MSETTSRVSLSDRIARANAARTTAAPSKEEIEAARLASFEINEAFRGHAEELHAIVGHISAALPSWSAYMMQKDPIAASLPENCVIDARASIENPACVFVWEVKSHRDGALANLPDDKYNEVLNATAWLDGERLARVRRSGAFFRRDGESKLILACQLRKPAHEFGHWYAVVVGEDGKTVDGGYLGVVGGEGNPADDGADHYSVGGYLRHARG